MSAQKYHLEFVADFTTNPPQIGSVQVTQVSPVPPATPPVTPPPVGNQAGANFNLLTRVQQGIVTALTKFCDEDIAEKIGLDSIADQNERNRRMIAIGHRETAVIGKINAYKGLAESARSNDRTGINPQVLATIDAGKVLLSTLGTSVLPTITTPATPSRADWSVLFDEIKSVDLTKELMNARNRWDAAHPR